jgi:biopolymer transport protein ExbD
MRESVDEQLGEDESEINLTPMLDVVFIMLIFFIVTAVFVREPGVEVQKPEAVTAFTPDSASIFVAITANDEIWVDRNQVDVPGVRPAIERLHAENPEGGVVIQADSGAHNGTLIAVMDSIKEAGVTEITIAASQP